MGEAVPQAAGDGFRRAAEQALSRLRWHWGEAYRVWHDADGWHARRRDGRGGDITASSPEELQQAIHKDYAALPVPRDLPGEGQ